MKPDFYPVTCPPRNARGRAGNLPAGPPSSFQERGGGDRGRRRPARVALERDALARRRRRKPTRRSALMEKIPPIRAESDEKREKRERWSALSRRAISRARRAGRGRRRPSSRRPAAAYRGPDRRTRRRTADRGIAAVRGLIAEREGRYEEAVAALPARRFRSGPAAGASSTSRAGDMLRVALAQSLAALGRTERGRGGAEAGPLAEPEVPAGARRSRPRSGAGSPAPRALLKMSTGRPRPRARRRGLRPPEEGSSSRDPLRRRPVASGGA